MSLDRAVILGIGLNPMIAIEPFPTTVAGVTTTIAVEAMMTTMTTSVRVDRIMRRNHTIPPAKISVATLIGAAVGGFAGHEAGHNPLVTLIGAAAGAYGGHELEKRHEKKKDEKRRESEMKHESRSVEYADPYADDERNSRRSRGGDYEDDDDDDDYDGHRHHHHHHHRDD